MNIANVMWKIQYTVLVKPVDVVLDNIGAYTSIDGTVGTIYKESKIGYYYGEFKDIPGKLPENSNITSIEQIKGELLS